jgi:signal transduction histidine kinase/DNA-binding response OmpR family regulator/HPt (histidine-containing phosphotransfer) domain-containing protein
MISNEGLSIDNEKKRVEELHSYTILDQIPILELDEISKSLTIIYDAPISAVSLLDDSFVYLKSVIGFEGWKYPKSISFCRVTIETDDVFISEDTSLDPNFIENPFVTHSPFIRFYAGMSLITPAGYKIGTVCILDYKPRKFDENEKFVMKTFAKQAITILELRKQNKELLTLNEKTIKLSKVKEDFFNNMSHELRTPLNAIFGFTEILNKTNLDFQQQEQLNIIRSSLDILICLINDILDFSKIETGNLKIEKHSFNFPKLINTTYELLKIKSEEKSLKFEVNISEQIPIYLIGDRLRISQILINLLGNAIKFTKKGSVNLNIEVIKETEEDILLNFSVKDTGIGIRAEKLQMIFDRFHQIEGITRIYGGSGLGLNITKNLVELLNGKLQVKSDYGRGSEFSFYLKFEKPMGEFRDLLFKKSFEEPSCHTDFKNLKILLVEDNLINVKLIQKIFEGTYVLIDHAYNGKKCIQKLKLRKYDVILMDINMPEMNGIDATKYIRKNMMLNIPIIALSANLSESDKKICLEIGMNDYLTKPISFDLLLKCVQKHVESTNNLIDKSGNTIIKPRKSIKLRATKKDKSLTNINKKATRGDQSFSKCPNNFTLRSKYRKQSSLDISKISTSDSLKEINIDEEMNFPINPNSNLPIKHDKIINLEYFREYSLDDRDFEKELVEIFLKETPIYMNELNLEIEKENFGGIKNAAHKMKSPLGIFGALDLIKSFTNIEESSEKCDIHTITKNYLFCSSQIDKMYKEMKTLFQSNILL